MCFAVRVCADAPEHVPGGPHQQGGARVFAGRSPHPALPRGQGGAGTAPHAARHGHQVCARPCCLCPSASAMRVAWCVRGSAATARCLRHPHRMGSRERTARSPYFLCACCVSVRECSDKEYFVSPMMRDHYRSQGYPDAFPQRSKTLLLFQVQPTASSPACVSATVPKDLLALGWHRPGVCGDELCGLRVPLSVLCICCGALAGVRGCGCHHLRHVRAGVRQ